ncbi:MAG: hypothetical protein AAF541_23210 [Pseudomonadota bacterium]
MGAYEFSWFAIPGVVGGSVAWLGAFFVLRYLPDSKSRYLLAALLVCEGALVWTSYSGISAFFPSASFEDLYPIFLLHGINDFLVVALYLPTLATFVDSPMLRPFKASALRFVPGAVAAVCILALIFGPLDLHFAEVLERSPGYPGSVMTPGPVWSLAFLLLAFCYTYGLIATILAWRRSASDLERRKNGFLTASFGVRDITFVLTFAGGVALTIVDPTGDIYGIEAAYFAAFSGVTLIAIGLVFYIFLAAYGVLSVHMFDIDLKLKVTLSRSTVTALYIAFFFLVSETSAALLSDQFGLLIGLAATAVLLFFIAPLQRWAEKLSDSAMPGVTESPEYLSFRKMQIYGEAISSTLREHGELTAVDRVILNQLSEKLGITRDEANALELEIVGQN